MSRYEIEPVRRDAQTYGHERLARELTSIPMDDSRIRSGTGCPFPGCPGGPGEDRFSLMKDFDETGGTYCRKCGGNSDIFATVAKDRGITFPEALTMIAEHIGSRPSDTAKAPKDPAANLEFREWNDQLVALWCLKKPGITPQVAREFGGRVATYRKRHAVIAFPIYGPQLSSEDIVGWVLYPQNGLTLPVWTKGDKQPTWEKVKTTAGSKQGILAPLDRLAKATTIWKAEGPPDAMALQGILPDGHVAITNANGAKEKPLDWITDLGRDREVYVLHDADVPGQEGAMWVGESGGRMRPGWAPAFARKTVTYNVTLPYENEPGHGKDARDWINEGNGWDELRQLPKEQIDPSAAPWPEIDRYEDRHLPAFPVDVLPDSLRTWVEQQSIATQTPPEMTALQSMATVAFCISRHVTVEPRRGWTEPTNLYTAVLMDPGNRKSAVFHEVRAPLMAIENELKEQQAPELARMKSEIRQDEKRLKELETKAAKTGDQDIRAEAIALSVQLDQTPEPTEPRLVVDESTPEKIGILLERDGRLMSTSTEGGVFDIMAGQYSKSGIPQFGVYLSGHSGDDIIVDRISRATCRVQRPALTCAYLVQPQVIEGLADNAAFRGRGLLARFLYSKPTSWVGSREVAPPPVTESARLAYHQIVRRCFEAAAASPCTLTLTRQAQGVLYHWEVEIESMLAEGGQMEMMRDWGSKLAGATLRIAAVLHSIEHGPSGEIGADTLASAIHIARYLIPHAEVMLELMTATEDRTHDDARYILRWIERHERTEFTRRDLHQDLKRRFPHSEDLDECLKDLMDRGYIREVDTGHPTSRKYEVHPQAMRSTEDIGGAFPNSGFQPGASTEDIGGAFRESKNHSDWEEVTL